MRKAVGLVIVSSISLMSMVTLPLEGQGCSGILSLPSQQCGQFWIQPKGWPPFVPLTVYIVNNSNGVFTPAQKAAIQAAEHLPARTMAGVPLSTTQSPLPGGISTYTAIGAGQYTPAWNYGGLSAMSCATMALKVIGP